MYDNRVNERRLLRLESLMRLYRFGFFVSLAVIVVLVGLLAAGNRKQFGRAIRIDGEIQAMVKNERDAAAVREEILALGKGNFTGDAAFKETWMDEPWPMEGAQVLSVAEAVEKLAPKLTVMVGATAIEADGQELVIVPNRDIAEKALDQLKSRFDSTEDAVVKVKKLSPEPAVRDTTASPSAIVTDIPAIVEKLAGTRAKTAEYTVKAGDYPSKIATAHGMKMDEFWKLNPNIRGKDLHAGQKVQVTGKETGLAVITVKVIVVDEEITPPVETQNSDALAKGERKVVYEGKPGSKRVRYEVRMHNEQVTDRKAISQEVIAQPEARRVLVGTKT